MTYTPHTKHTKGISKICTMALAALVLLPAALAPGSTARGAGLAQGAAPGSGDKANTGAANAPEANFTITGPGPTTIPESDDYASQVQGDPWDMNNPEDIDYPHNFSAPSVSNGIWSATTTGSPSDSEMSLKLLEQNFATTASYIGEKDGRNYPIPTQRFTRLIFRMYSDVAGRMILWYYKNPGDSAPCNNSNCHSDWISAEAGWHIYETNLNINPANWANLGTVAGIRFDAPNNQFNNNIKFDWVRITPDTSTPVQITFRPNGNANVNFYLGSTPDPNSREILLKGGVSSTAGSWTWDHTGVAPGTYYIHGEQNGQWSTSGPITVNAAPVLNIIAPGPLSGEDFAQARLGQTWDGSNPNQLQLYENLTGPPTFNGEYMQATSLTVPGTTVEDPSVYWMYPYRGQDRGAIDASRYHYLTIKLWLQAPSQRPGSPGNLGPRLSWNLGGGAEWVQSEGIYAPYNRWIPMSLDLTTMPKAPGTGAYGWSGDIRIFRFDPHEEDDTKQPAMNLPFFRIMSTHLMSQPIADNATLVRWSKMQGGGTVNFYYDTNNSGYDGQLIASNVPIDIGQVGWNTSGLPNGGQYWVYAVASDGLNTSRYYSLLPVRIDHGSSSTIFVDVPTNNPFADDIANLSARNIINGYGQPDSTIQFRPGATATRAQLSKMVVLGAGGDLVTPNTPSFMDVPATSPLYIFVETAARRGIISGYKCGGAGEPCDGSGRNYFRPNSNVTRAQTAKMIVLSRNWSEYRPNTPTFADVPADSPLFGFVEESARRGIISGYACGGAGEPCTGGNKPYFRPNRDVTRGQISKMLSQAIGPFTGASASGNK
ncbi:MAG: hypothetical protein QOH93_2992 [Chloroflexia bacterium]|jgi:hypothetical protein|nr:hypothetical protein [Chloroflexia bacterium]